MSRPHPLRRRLAALVALVGLVAGQAAAVPAPVQAVPGSADPDAPCCCIRPVDAGPSCCEREPRPGGSEALSSEECGCRTTPPSRSEQGPDRTTATVPHEGPTRELARQAERARSTPVAEVLLGAASGGTDDPALESRPTACGAPSPSPHGLSADASLPARLALLATFRL